MYECELCGVPPTEAEGWGSIEETGHENIHYHHTSWNPEETMRVCGDCHFRIHHEDGFHDELIPEGESGREY